MRSVLWVGPVALAAVSAVGFGVGMALTGSTHPADMSRGVTAPITPPPDVPVPANLVPPSVGTPPVLPVGSTQIQAPAQPAQPVQQPPANPDQPPTDSDSDSDSDSGD